MDNVFKQIENSFCYADSKQLIPDVPNDAIWLLVPFH